MNNYEWLVEKGKLENFLFDIMNHACAISDEEADKIAELILGEYKLDLKGESDYAHEQITEWLQAEHKESEEYVLLKQVIDTVNSRIPLLYMGGGTTIAEVVIEHLKTLPRKEID